ncbi:MarR family transcriptional regulator [Limibacter armeniacum]|uniref:MarR family winged helix-turn-helix transcriptional regulator n=1 Tax=Limibacter armeniacum TaxID=466084 RepID=UPI002FE66408
MDFYKELGALIFGSRLKRISDRFLSDVNKVYTQLEIPFDASWFPVFYLLDKEERISLIEVSDKLEVSHSAISQLVTNLERKKLVKTEKDPEDGRKRLITLTNEGLEVKNKAKAVWDALQGAMGELLMEGTHSQHLLKGFDELENNLDQKDLKERVLEKIGVSSQ